VQEEKERRFVAFAENALLVLFDRQEVTFRVGNRWVYFDEVAAG